MNGRRYKIAYTERAGDRERVAVSQATHLLVERIAATQTCLSGVTVPRNLSHFRGSVYYLFICLLIVS